MPTPAEEAELIEALIWRAMAEHAAIPDRGFDSARDRLRLRCQIDDMFDTLAELRQVAQLEEQVSA